MKILRYICYSLLTFLVFANEVTAQDINTILDKVKAKIDKVKDYQASGTMKLNVSFLQVPDSRVMVYYKQPDKFRVRQSKGISLVPKGGISINLNTMLNNGNYTVVDGGSSLWNKQQLRVIKLLPLEENDEVVLSTFYIDPKENLVKKVVTTTKENGSYAIEFMYGKYRDWALPDELVFSFNTKDYKLPKGMTFDYDEDIKPDTTKLKSTKGEVRLLFSNYIINKGVNEEVFK